LSKLIDMQAVAYYSLAMRFLLPIMIVTHSITRTFYPVLSSYWKKADGKFRKTQQASLEVSFLIAGAFFCIINAAAEFLMSLIGPELADAAYLLRILSWAVMARAVTAAMYPLVVIAGKQEKALGLTLLTVLASVTLVLSLVPAYGVLGVAYAFVCIEFVFSMIPTILISQHVALYKPNWFPVVKALLSAALSLACTAALGLMGTIWGGAIALALYLALVLLTGAVSLSKLRVIVEIIKTRKSGSDDPAGNSDLQQGPEEHG
jgi:O-antigen/teichoic acid export membrane protein